MARMELGIALGSQFEPVVQTGGADALFFLSINSRAPDETDSEAVWAVRLISSLFARTFYSPTLEDQMYQNSRERAIRPQGGS